ncbi:MAG: hypothetical protein IT388_05980 [Nitrospirales bacterium]|nr:hypothetical protein [Nitrospirales bacterium]
MARHKDESADSGKAPLEKGVSPEQGAGESGGEECRCKEVARKPLPELLRLMLRDLAFWKKTEGPKRG